MRGEQTAVLEALDRVQFLDDHHDVLTRVSGTLRVRLDESAARLPRLDAEKRDATRGGQEETVRLKALRKSLRYHTAPIIAAARAKLNDAWAIGALEVPSLPAPVDRELAAALSLADFIEPHARTLIDVGLPETFIEDLRAAIAAIQGSVDLRTRFELQRTRATAALAAAESEARAVRRLLDSLVMAEIAGSPALVAEWKEASAVGRSKVFEKSPRTLGDEKPYLLLSRSM